MSRRDRRVTSIMAASPAGWYPDPDGFPLSRYWDGALWTSHTQPLPPAPDPYQAQMLAMARQQARAAQRTAHSTHMMWSLLGAVAVLLIAAAVFYGLNNLVNH